MMEQDIVDRLTIKSHMINMGESIAFGYETALMDESADEITRLRQLVEWTPIGEMPEEYKDGRELDLFCPSIGRATDCIYRDGWKFKADEWTHPRWTKLLWEPTHYKLIAPPEQQEP